MSEIDAKERQLKKIFSNDYTFKIPEYQRPYSWGKEQVEELIDDLSFFALKNEKEPDPYFLGSIVIIKSKTNSDSKVVDGQQRLTTLTILFSIVRELISDSELKNDFNSYIFEKGSKIEGRKDTFRLSIGHKDNEFFQQFIQKEGGFSRIPEEKELSDSQAKIRENAFYIKNKLDTEFTEDQLIDFMRYIITNCYLVTVSTSDEESAYRIFSVLNDRGIQLSHADILKAEIIGQLPVEDRQIYADRWVNKEEELGIDQFRTLFAHIRMINRKIKSRDTILKEIRTYVDPKSRPKEFIDQKLIPYANALHDIKNASFSAISNASTINSYLNWLNKLDNEDWIPPTILFLSKWGQKDTGKVFDFLKKLERLAFGMHVLRITINGRIERYGKILLSIENDDFDQLDLDMKIHDDEIDKIKNLLKEDVYHTQFIRYLLLRIDNYLAAGTASNCDEVPASYEFPIISIEHVLPQNPPENSDWMVNFPDEDERKNLTNCLGNLVLLSRRKNSKAQNYDFDKKKERYFKKDGSSPFSLTSQVTNYEKWTPDVINSRQNELLNMCNQMWDL